MTHPLTLAIAPKPAGGGRSANNQSRAQSIGSEVVIQFPSFREMFGIHVAGGEVNRTASGTGLAFRLVSARKIEFAEKSAMPGETNETRASKSWLEITESIFKIASYVAVPVVLAIGGWVIQSSLSKQAVSKDYVNMALGLVQKKPETDQERELRDWAVDLLDDNAPTKLPPKTKTDLKSGVLNFGNIFGDATRSSPTFGFAVSPDSKNIAIGGYGEIIRIYDVATGKLASTSVPEVEMKSPLKVPLFSAFATPSAETTSTPRKGVVLQPDSLRAMMDAVDQYLGSSYVSALAYSPDGLKILFGTSEGSVKLWNLKTGEILNFAHEKAAVAAVAFTSGGNNVLVRDLNGRIQTFDSAGKRVGEVKLRSEQ